MKLDVLLENKGGLSEMAMQRLFDLQEQLGIPVEQWEVPQWERCVINEAFSKRASYRVWRSQMRTMLNNLQLPDVVEKMESVNYDEVWAFKENNTDLTTYVGSIEELMSKFECSGIKFKLGKFSLVWSAYILFWYGFTMNDIRLVKKKDLVELGIKRPSDGEVVKLDPKAYDVLKKFATQRATVSDELHASEREYSVSEYLFRKSNNPTPKVPHYATDTEMSRYLKEFSIMFKCSKDLTYRNVYDSGYFSRINESVCAIKSKATVKHITQLPEFRELFNEHKDIKLKKIKSTNVYRELYRRFVQWHNLYYDDKITD